MTLILGFTERTSFSLAKYLLSQGKSIIIADQSKTQEKDNLLTKLSQYGTIFNELGCQNKELLTKYSISEIFISPGVPRAIPLIQKAIENNIPILNDIEYFYRQFPDRYYIGITGTDGKTTISTWLYETIKPFRPSILGGNIGVPIFEFVETVTNAIHIIELSSFQLESISSFTPRQAVITNILEDHIDRYPSIKAYADTKISIFQNMQSGALYNKDDSYFSEYPKINHQTFSMKTTDADWYYKDGKLYYQNKCFFNTKELKVAGMHNIQNALIVSALAYGAGLSLEEISCGLKLFQGVSHRLQFVENINNIKFYNDSKATTANAVQISLQAFDKKVILLAGGRSKNIDFSSLQPLIQEKTKAVFLFGEMQEELSQAWNTGKQCGTLEHSFQNACQIAESGDIILLSPGGTSLDAYQSYEARGNHFIEMVHQFKHKNI